MTIKRKLETKSVNYFCTFTCFDWLPLIQITSAYDVFYKWFHFMKKYGNEITGFVLMPNHAHLLIFLGEESPTIDKLVGNGKRFLAYEIVKRLEQLHRSDILKRLEAGVSISDKKRNKKHQVFRHSFDVKICDSEAFIWQKLDYMHWNPLSGKWNLASSPDAYPHSSALFYMKGKQGHFPIKDFRIM